MSLFRCEECGCVENTATSNYWGRQYTEKREPGDTRKLCSECDPEVGVWHGEFPKESANGWKIDAQGWVWHPDVEKLDHTTLVGVVPGEREPEKERKPLPPLFKDED
jgi:hypothetical protein